MARHPNTKNFERPFGKRTYKEVRDSYWFENQMTPGKVAAARRRRAVEEHQELRKLQRDFPRDPITGEL